VNANADRNNGSTAVAVPFDPGPNHSWLTQQLSGGVGLSLWNCAGYSIVLTFTPEQARAIGAALIQEADRTPVPPRVGTAADLGCASL
jgi:hypothetical protein